MQTSQKINWYHPIHFLSFGFGSGLIPKAPGTFGTLMAIPLFLLMSELSLELYIAVVCVAFALGIFICGFTAKAMKVHDHGSIVWDEFVGYWLTMLVVPLSWWWVVAGFVLFRLFDILKPWPIRVLDQRVKGGFGIMLDDVIAAVFAWLCLQALILIF